MDNRHCYIQNYYCPCTFVCIVGPGYGGRIPCSPEIYYRRLHDICLVASGRNDQVRHSSNGTLNCSVCCMTCSCSLWIWWGEMGETGHVIEIFQCWYDSTKTAAFIAYGGGGNVHYCDLHNARHKQSKLNIVFLSTSKCMCCRQDMYNLHEESRQFNSITTRSEPWNCFSL